MAAPPAVRLNDGATSTLAPVWAWLRLDLRRRIRALTLLGLLVAVGSGAVMASAAGALRGESAAARLLDATLPAHAMASPTSPASTGTRSAACQAWPRSGPSSSPASPWKASRARP
ncbi:hypothetical protein Acor_07790 [Acrocarpospora corrugata]|uniref:Uncharacterized protein n=1 Tax=Acrocarpospora corrugata TaxID=35763 RepID=A0A5M3VPK1_9ACTN|nr:hypothetical protein [Acrocarpospora corrugata]GER98716.1 hypothetical protein Acor_07790 [Acrocarpospora corrugata]